MGFRNSYNGAVARTASRQLQTLQTQHDIERTALRDENYRLEDRIEKIALQCEALWQLMQREYGFTEEQLREEVHRLDASDGAVDGRRQPQPVDCYSCGAKIGAKMRNCQFCGALPQPTDTL